MDTHMSQEWTRFNYCIKWQIIEKVTGRKFFKKEKRNATLTS